MAYNRQSGVSSFYGDRRSSVDALNQDFSQPPPASRGRYESNATSFYDSGGQSQRSTEMLRPQGAGYNRMSYLDAGRVEPVKGGYDEEAHRENEGGWDVFADFNNKGPRYSSAFGIGQNQGSYQAVPPVPGKLGDAPSVGPVEMVTVPALGPEWKASEMKEMTKLGRREKKAESRAAKWKQFRRGERGLLGKKWLTRKVLVFIMFAIAVVIAVVLAVTIPRVPGFAIDSTDPLVQASGDFNSSIPSEFSRSPANFSFPGLAQLEVDTSSSILPLTFTKLDALVYDLDSSKKVGTGSLGKQRFPANTFTAMQFPLNFSYTATNDSDTTWVNWYDACRNSALNANGTRPGLRFRLDIDFWIAGLIPKHSTTTSVTDADCPIELSQNSA